MRTFSLFLAGFLLVGCTITQQDIDTITDLIPVDPGPVVPTPPVPEEPKPSPVPKPSPTTSKINRPPMKDGKYIVRGSGYEMDGSNGFLNKPVSERLGALVTLYPKQYIGKIVAADLYRNFGTASQDLIEKGIFWTRDYNGPRDHWRYAKLGSSYGKDVVNLITLASGEQIGWFIPDCGQRWD